MLLRQMLLGSTKCFSPEDDRGAAGTGLDDEDFDLDLDDDPAEDDNDLEDEDLDPEDEPDEEDLDLDDPKPEPKASRGDNRVATATREAKEAKEQVTKLERELAAERQSRAQPTETQEQFNTRLNAMEPWERTEYLRQLDAQTTQRRLDQIQFDAWDRGDKLEYDTLAQRQPIAAKLKDDVEKLLSERRAVGQNVDRQTVLKYLIGERALAGKGRAEGKARKTADANRDRQAARPTGGRADTTGGDTRGRGDSAAARAKRLENMEI